MVVVLVLAGGAWWYSGLGYESTDDAFVEGLTVRISPRISGIVTRVAVDDNQHVKAGDLLFELDPRDYQAAASKARAAVAAAGSRAATAKANLALVKASTEATLRQAESKVAVAQATLKRRHAELAAAKVEAARALRDAERYRKLSTNDFASRQRLDQANAQAESAAAQVRAAEGAAAEAKADVARAQAELASAQTAPQQIAVREAELTTAQAELESAQAALERAELDLSYTEITAPHDGVITRKTASEGDFVSPGEALSSLVYGRPWVVANFKETQLTTMQPGQPVKVDID
ncbi:MAG TPA: HlyD family secretion protein, partial [Alphaproteobacteria bacterium]|nr:HlyD family secretion protein [Alphaproteobacteria bacterium]